MTEPIQRIEDEPQEQIGHAARRHCVRWSTLFFALGLGAYAWLASAACGKTGATAEARTIAKLPRDPPTAAYGFHPVPLVQLGTPCPGAYAHPGDSSRVPKVSPRPQ